MTGTTRSRDSSTFSSAEYLGRLMAELDRAAISTRIRHARRKAGFRNRQQLADVMQVHWRTIEDWENPKHQNVPWDRMEELAGVLNVDKKWLLHGDPEPRTSTAGDDRLESIVVRLESLEAQVAQSVKLTKEALRLLRAAPPQAGAAPRARRRETGTGG